MYLRKLNIILFVVMICADQICVATGGDTGEETKTPFYRKASPINFGGFYELRPIRDDDESSESLEKLLQEPVSLFFEDGRPWTKEKAKQRVPTVASHVIDWEKGENLSLPWTLIYYGSSPVGLFLMRYHKGGRHPGYLEVACALCQEMWGKGLVLQAIRAYASKYVLPILEDCLGAFASVNIKNEKAVAALKKYWKAGEEYIIRWGGDSEDSIWKDYMITTKEELKFLFDL